VTFVTPLLSFTASLDVTFLTSGANPSYTPEELAYQLSTTKATVLVIHPDALENALIATRQVGMPLDHIFPLCPIQGPLSSTVGPDLDQLIGYGLAHRPNFVERRLRPGEAKTKVAFLSFSSGTTGKPKVCNLSCDKQ